MEQTKVAILGSGNIGTDLVVKALRSPDLDVAGVAGIDPDSTGLAKARRLGVRTSDRGVTGLMSWADFDEISLIFDATSAKAHIANNAALEPQGKTVIDLTPAALGPYVVPPVNLRDHLHAANINMVTCGGQATIPIVAAVSRVAPVHYAEIVASIASRSAGPGTRANIDEFTVTTSRAIEVVGEAAKGKSVIILNPGEPPVLMRDTIHCIIDEAEPDAVRSSIERMVTDVARYVPGYRLKQEVQISGLPAADALETLVPGLAARDRQKVTVFLEIEGAADYLPAYAGNLDIMTAAAIQVAEQIAADRKVATA